MHALFSSLPFVFSTSVIDCLGRFVPEMTYYVSSGTLNLTKLKLASFKRRWFHIVGLAVEKAAGRAKTLMFTE